MSEPIPEKYLTFAGRLLVLLAGAVVLLTPILVVQRLPAGMVLQEDNQEILKFVLIPVAVLPGLIVFGIAAKLLNILGIRVFRDRRTGE